MFISPINPGFDGKKSDLYKTSHNQEYEVPMIGRNVCDDAAFDMIAAEIGRESISRSLSLRAANLIKHLNKNAAYQSYSASNE